MFPNMKMCKYTLHVCMYGSRGMRVYYVQRPRTESGAFSGAIIAMLSSIARLRLPANLGSHSESCHGYLRYFLPAGTAKPNGVGGAPPLQVHYPKSEFLGRENCTEYSVG